MRDYLTTKNLSNDDFYTLIKKALYYKQHDGFFKNYENQIIANLFFEDSTRTRTSFEVAELKLGFRVLNFSASSSSVNKGESLYDTCKTFESLGTSVLVIRHKQNNYFDDLVGLNAKVVNAGDGSGAHPSQCLLDLVTIYEHFNTFNGLKIAIVGDIKNSRVAKSNKDALERLGAKVFLVAPPIYQDNSYNEYYKLDEIIDEVDVCMLLRIQHERHDKNELDLEKYRKSFALTTNNYKRLKNDAIIMHPAPINREVEIDSCLVECEKSKIFTQMSNGVFARMAILDYVYERI